MTIGEAVGVVIACWIDDVPIDPALRREIAQALPLECRFMSPDGTIPALETLQAIVDWKDIQR